jgi:saccharopine dehydrogenase-like NADP-dependent oxidoreductase
MEWLGLLDKIPLPFKRGSALENLAALMSDKLRYEKDERDMIVLLHTFVAKYPQGTRESITSTLIDYGIPGEDFAMARTVGYPAAIASRLILEEKIRTPGIHIPIDPAIFTPILKELKDMNITFNTKIIPL